MDNELIKADGDVLFRQASMTAHDYMRQAARDIDEMFGEGFSDKNPQLVGDFMKVSAIDYGTAIIGKIMESGLNRIATALTSLSESVADLRRD